MEEPEDEQSEWKSKSKGAKQGVPESVVGTEAKKIFEVGREGAHQQRRKNEMEAAKR